LLQAKLAQFHFDSDQHATNDASAGFGQKALYQLAFALVQRLAGDTTGAKITAGQVRNTLEPLCRDQLGKVGHVAELSQAYVLMGEKDLALKEAEHAIMLLSRAKDSLAGPTYEESLALIQTMFGENSRAISTLAQLLRTPSGGSGFYYQTPITPALLRLDPLWDPLRGDPAFQKLCEEKQLPATP
jgi:hypothetical protein